MNILSLFVSLQQVPQQLQEAAGGNAVAESLASLFQTEFVHAVHDAAASTQKKSGAAASGSAESEREEAEPVIADALMSAGMILSAAPEVSATPPLPAAAGTVAASPVEGTPALPLQSGVRSIPVFVAAEGLPPKPEAAMPDAAGDSAIRVVATSPATPAEPPPEVPAQPIPPSPSGDQAEQAAVESASETPAAGGVLPASALPEGDLLFTHPETTARPWASLSFATTGHAGSAARGNGAPETAAGFAPDRASPAPAEGQATSANPETSPADSLPSNARRPAIAAASGQDIADSDTHHGGNPAPEPGANLQTATIGGFEDSILPPADRQSALPSSPNPIADAGWSHPWASLSAVAEVAAAESSVGRLDPEPPPKLEPNSLPIPAVAAQQPTTATSNRDAPTPEAALPEVSLPAISTPARAFPSESGIRAEDEHPPAASSADRNPLWHVSADLAAAATDELSLALAHADASGAQEMVPDIQPDANPGAAATPHVLPAPAVPAEAGRETILPNEPAPQKAAPAQGGAPAETVLTAVARSSATQIYDAGLPQAGHRIAMESPRPAGEPPSAVPVPEAASSANDSQAALPSRSAGEHTASTASAEGTPYVPTPAVTSRRAESQPEPEGAALPPERSPAPAPQAALAAGGFSPDQPPLDAPADALPATESRGPFPSVKDVLPEGGALAVSATQYLQQTNQNEMKIHLRSEALGPVVLHAIDREGVFEATIGVSDPAAHELIARDLPALHTSLRQQDVLFDEIRIIQDWPSGPMNFSGQSQADTADTCRETEQQPVIRREAADAPVAPSYSGDPWLGFGFDSAGRLNVRV